MSDNILPSEISKEKYHKLGCDEMHQHVAPMCCRTTCWCLPKLAPMTHEPANDALTHWELTNKKLTEDQEARINSFIHGLESCLKLSNGRVYLGLEANSMLAWEFYKTDSTRPRPKPKGRREAIEHTRNLNEEQE